MNRFDEALERIKKNLEIQIDWTEEDFDHYKTIVFALEIASDLCEVDNLFKETVSQNDSCGKGKKKGGAE
jgi:hypothetical protein